MWTFRFSAFFRLALLSSHLHSSLTCHATPVSAWYKKGAAFHLESFFLFDVRLRSLLSLSSILGLSFSSLAAQREAVSFM